MTTDYANDYAKSVSNEIHRLTNLGWIDRSELSEGVLQTGEIDETSISFPSESYLLEGVNEVADGVWARHRADRIIKILKSHGVQILWEVGVGNGNAAIPISQSGIPVIGIEPLRSGATRLANEGYIVYCDVLQNLQLPDNSLAAIGAFDVIEHLENPREVLAEIYRVLQPGGILVTTVPAYQWMFSDFDTSIGHFRRYSRTSLKWELNNSGFTNNSISHFFFFLVFPALFLRVLPYRMGRRRDFTRVEKSNKLANKVIGKLGIFVKLILYIESFIGLPMGLSLISTSRKSVLLKI